MAGKKEFIYTNTGNTLDLSFTVTLIIMSNGRRSELSIGGNKV